MNHFYIKENKHFGLAELRNPFSISASLSVVAFLFSPSLVVADSLVFKAGFQDFKSSSDRWPMVGVEYLRPFSSVSLSLSALNTFDFVYGGSESQYSIGILNSTGGNDSTPVYFGAGVAQIQTSVDGSSNGWYLQLGYRWRSDNRAQHGIELRMVEGKDIQYFGSTTPVGSTQLAYTYLFNPFSR
jgi:hypothetical protein